MTNVRHVSNLNMRRTFCGDVSTEKHSGPSGYTYTSLEPIIPKNTFSSYPKHKYFLNGQYAVRKFCNDDEKYFRCSLCVLCGRVLNYANFSESMMLWNERKLEVETGNVGAQYRKYQECDI